MSYLKLAGWIGGALIAAFLWWRVSLSFSQADTIDAQRSHIAGLELAAARDQRIATEIATFRGQQFDFNAQYQQKLTSQPLTHKEPPHVDPVTGKQEPCVVRDAARYRSLFNEAVTGSAASGVP